MKEIIKSIKEVNDVKLEKQKWSNFDGFEIETDKQIIKVLISNDQNCCENAGYLSSFEDPKEFIGAILNKIEVVNESLNKEEWNKRFEYGLDGGGVMFVNFETDKGTFQLTAYNSHNGYYSHSAFLISNDLNLQESL